MYTTTAWNHAFEIIFHYLVQTQTFIKIIDRFSDIYKKKMRLKKKIPQEVADRYLLLNIKDRPVYE